MNTKNLSSESSSDESNSDGSSQDGPSSGEKDLVIESRRGG